MNIDKYKGLYTIKEDGTILNTKTNKKIKHHIGYGGYPAVVLLGNDGKQHHEYVHRLLAETFIPNPNNLPIINHKDENPLNFSLDNLERCSYSYNNTYNEVNKRRAEKLKGTTPWNKGVSMSEEQKQKISKSCVGRPFMGNQYVKINK